MGRRRLHQPRHGLFSLAYGNYVPHICHMAEADFEAVLDEVEGQIAQAHDSRAPAVRAVSLIEHAAARLSGAAGLEEAEARVVIRSTLRAGTLVAIRLASGADAREAASAAYAAWAGQIAQLGVRVPGLPSTRPLSPLSREDAADESTWEDLLLEYEAIVCQRLIRNERQDQGRDVLQQLKRELDVSFDDLGRPFGVNGETVRRWMQGRTPIPSERLAAISQAGSTHGRIRSHFRPERIAMVVRRPADVFDGDSALDWILGGRMEEVADRYDDGLRFQA